eukprot:6343073-Prymnesium_polylepis.1
MPGFRQCGSAVGCAIGFPAVGDIAPSGWCVVAARFAEGRRIGQSHAKRPVAARRRAASER